MCASFCANLPQTFLPDNFPGTFAPPDNPQNIPVDIPPRKSLYRHSPTDICMQTYLLKISQDISHPRQFRQLPSKKSICVCERNELAYHGHIFTKKGDCLEKELIQDTTPGSRTRGRPKMTWRQHKIVDWVVTDRTNKECGRQTSIEKDCSQCG